MPELRTVTRTEITRTTEVYMDVDRLVGKVCEFRSMDPSGESVYAISFWFDGKHFQSLGRTDSQAESFALLKNRLAEAEGNGQ